VEFWISNLQSIPMLGPVKLQARKTSPEQTGI